MKIKEVLTETSGFLEHFCELPLVAVLCKQENIALPLDSAATENYLSATVLSPHSCIATDSSWLWQIGRDFCRRMRRHNRLFCWLKAADETHHSDVNVWTFFGFTALQAAFRSHNLVTVTQVQLWSKQCMHFVPHINPVWSVPTACARLTFKYEKWGNHN